ncbi:MAG TPA: DciA family protein [Thermoanaerobaculia bacterium]|nr:DciA family protein [Thermoanaerobaculia bacterium]
MKRKKDSFTRLDTMAEGLLCGMFRREDALLWLQARWGRIVGEPLSRKIEPAELSGRRLTVSLLDPAWKKPVEATLPELERKLALELPEVRPRITLREPVRRNR